MVFLDPRGDLRGDAGLKIWQPETGAVLVTGPFTIMGEKYFEERILPHRLFSTFVHKLVRRGGARLFLGCPFGAVMDRDGKCRVYPRGKSALVIASIYHPYEQLAEFLRGFQADIRNEKHLEIRKRYEDTVALIRRRVPRPKAAGRQRRA